MPTNYRRVSVSVDTALAHALERARALRADGPARLADARLIHDLAIDGVDRLERSRGEHEALLAELADPHLTAAHLNAGDLRRVIALRDVSPLDELAR